MRKIWLSSNVSWSAAFTLTAVAFLYGTAGLLGYAVPLDNPIVEHRIMAVGHVVWPQVGMASMVALMSVYPWTLGLKQLRSLVLLGTGVTDEGVQELQRALPRCDISR